MNYLAFFFCRYLQQYQQTAFCGSVDPCIFCPICFYQWCNNSPVYWWQENINLFLAECIPWNINGLENKCIALIFHEPSHPMEHSNRRPGTSSCDSDLQIFWCDYTRMIFIFSTWMIIRLIGTLIYHTYFYSFLGSEINAINLPLLKVIIAM